MNDECLICAKHASRGPLAGCPVIEEDDLVVVTHRPVDAATGLGIAGHAFVETRRHVAHWPGLTAAETDAVARAAGRVARALAAEFGTDLVMSLIAGMSVPHFHQHVFVRHPGTPEDLPWFRSSEWSGAPQLTASELAALAERLAPR
ncbi:HIT domain-containing protein [Pseudonocardia sp. CA-107938]|uniref:HIT domain-containing protein n=1 Tax=Pseudonocardia sp. CA-107938 TaxID=3240021 RepID=UPI003D8E47FF